MQGLPLISVVIPTYNRRELLLRAVESVLIQKQPGMPFEVIVADDGSTDHSCEMLQREFNAAMSAGILKVLRHPGTHDAGAARNRGVLEARGEWLAFLDSDDYWVPERLARLKPLFTTKDLILGGRNAPPAEERKDLFLAALEMNFITTPAVAIKRWLWTEAGPFPESYFGKRARAWKGFEDYELWLRALAILKRRGALDRASYLENSGVVIETQTAGLSRMSVSEQMWREFFTIARVLPYMPATDLLAAFERMARALKGALFSSARQRA